MMFTFSGERVLILGGNSELALTLSRHLIEASAYPILTYRNDRGLQEIRNVLKPHAGKYEAHRLVLGDTESMENLFANIGDDIDSLVDFVQGDYESLVASADEEAVNRFFAENVAFRAGLLKRAVRIMIKRKKGRLIYISSTAAERPNPGQGFYAAAKLASEALYRNIGLEMAGHGITTAILRPGYVETGRGEVYLDTNSREALKKVPIGRPITAEEIAQAVAYLLSAGAGVINGTVVTLDGGLTLGK